MQSDYLPYVLIALGPILLLIYPIISGKSLFWGVPSLQFIPWQVYSFDRIMQGGLPFLNEYNGLGAPLLANYQLAIFYPFTWLSFSFYILGGAPLLAWSHTLILLMHLILGGIGMALLVKQWGGSSSGMVVGGLAFALSGYWVCRLGFFTMIWCGTWLPWEMLMVNELLEYENTTDQKYRNLFFLLVIVTTLQLLSGHAQIAWYSLGTVFMWTAASIVFRKDIKNPGKRCLTVIAGIIFAAWISSIQLLPTAEYLLQSQRSSSVDFAKALGYSFWPWHIFDFVMPNLFGSPANGDYWGYASYWEDAVYIGILPLASALSTLIILKRSKSISGQSRLRFLIFFGWLCVITGFILASGYNTFIFTFLFKYIPTFDMFNAPARIMVIPVFFLAWFSGIGISFWFKPRAKQKRWLKRLMVMGLAVIIGGIIAKVMIPAINPTVYPPFFIFGLSISILFWLILRIPFPERNPKWDIWVYLFVLIDLLVPTILFNPYIDSSFYQKKKIDNQGYSGRIFFDQENEYVLKFSKYLRFTDFSAPGDWNRLRTAMLPNINILNGVYSASNFDPLLPGRYQTWLDQYDISTNVQKNTMLEDMDVKTLEMADINEVDDGVYGIAKERIGLVNWASCFTKATTPENALNLTINNVNRGVVILEGVTEQMERTDCSGKDAQIEILKQSPEKVNVKINASFGGWIWTSLLYYPGWEVTVDHNPSQITRANYLFMGAYVPAGVHEIEFTYYPYAFIWGLDLSMVGCGFLIVLKLFIH